MTTAAPAFPSSLHTPTPVEGHELARRLARAALGGRPVLDMAAHLASPAPPSEEALTAVYFQAVAAANGGWPQR